MLAKLEFARCLPPDLASRLFWAVATPPLLALSIDCTAYFACHTEPARDAPVGRLFARSDGGADNHEGNASGGGDLALGRDGRDLHVRG